MELLDIDVGAADTALQEGPEVLKIVSVGATADVSNGVVNDIMSAISGRSIMGKQGVRLEGRTSLHMLANLSL